MWFDRVLGVGAKWSGAMRLAVGVWFLTDAARAARTLVDRDDPEDRYLVRATGGRDLAIAAGLLGTALVRGNVTPWLAAGTVSDAVDAIAVRRTIHGPSQTLILAGAGSSTALGAVLTAVSIIRRCR